MKILITGAFGFIGSNIIRLLESQGIDTIILDNFYSSNFKNLSDFKGEFIFGDILDRDVFKRLPKVGVVIHEAAITDTILTDDGLMLKVNFSSFKNIVEYCLSKKIKLVYASSAGVYGDGPMPAKETQAPRPLNAYAFSKYLCDQYVLNLTKKNRNLPIVGLRYFNVYGPGEAHKGKSASMIYQLYLQMKENKRPRIFKYGEQKRDFIYIKDVAKISVKALELNKSVILNVGTGKARSFNEIIKLLNKNLNTDLEPDYFDNPHRGGYQDYTQADITNLVNILKIKPQYSLEEGIEDYLQEISKEKLIL